MLDPTIQAILTQDPDLAQIQDNTTARLILMDAGLLHVMHEKTPEPPPGITYNNIMATAKWRGFTVVGVHFFGFANPADNGDMVFLVKESCPELLQEVLKSLSYECTYASRPTVFTNSVN